MPQSAICWTDVRLKSQPQPRAFSAELRHTLVVNDNVQQRRVDLQSAIIFDEAKLAELVHEEVDPRARRPHLRRQDVLVDDRDNRFQFSFLAEIGQEQEKTGEAAFARIEQLVNFGKEGK